VVGALPTNVAVHGYGKNIYFHQYARAD
jgi:hypothetical protein